MSMKKLFFLIATAFILLSCENDYQGTSMKVINLSARATDWKEDFDNNNLRYYYCTFNVPEINTLIANSGEVLSYIKLNNAQQILPYTRHFANTSGNLWTKTVDFEFANGRVTYFVTNSDFAIDPPEAMDFRLVLTW